MTRTKKLSLAGLAVVAALAAFAPVASARPPVVVFRGGFYGPAYYYRPWGWGWGPPPPYYYYTAPDTGGVKVETKMKDATVYVDKGFAGTVGQLKTFQLRPGTHDIEVRAPDGQILYNQQINVIAGKTVKVFPS